MNSFEQNYSLLLNGCASHAEEMFHEADGCLSHPYLDPGGPYSKNLWDWDSFWASTALLGISDIKGDSALKKKVLYFAKGAIDNFFGHQGEDGSLPILLSDKDPDWFDSTKDVKSNMAKPVFGQFCLLAAEHGTPSRDDGKRWLKCLEKFYDCYEKRYYNPGTGLYVWANDIAIGVDDDPATWGRPPFSSASLFLNCLLYMDMISAAKFANEAGNPELSLSFSGKAGELKKAINGYCWDPKDGLYYSVDVNCRQNLSSHRHYKTLNINLEPFWKCMPLKIACWTSFMPMWCGIASKENAERMVSSHLTATGKFWTDYGIRSLSAEEKMYSPDVSRGNPSNWLGPVWVISNYLAWKGLLNYGFNEPADRLSCNIAKLLADDYRRNGFLHEYYNPENGDAVSGPGFWNWNLLVCLMGKQGER